jgi:hypothetical protein
MGNYTLSYILVLGAEFIAAISASIYYSKYKNSSLKWLLPLLWYIPVNEVVCNFILEEKLFYLLYNIYDLITSCTILIVLRLSVVEKKWQRGMNILIVLNISSFFINFLTINPYREYTSLSFTISAFLIVIALLLYLVELLNKKIIIKVNRNIYLWVCSGFLIFHISYPILIYARKFLGDIKSILDPLNYIQVVIIMITYLTIAFGFHWGEKIEKNNY